MPSALRPHCPARDRLTTWIPLQQRRLLDAKGKDLPLPGTYLERIQEVLTEGFAGSTRLTYAAGLLSFHVFCDSHSIPELQRAPCSSDLLNAWISTMAGLYAGTSVANYVYGLRAWHIIHGVDWNIKQAQLETIIHGAQSLQPAQSKRKKR